MSARKPISVLIRVFRTNIAIMLIVIENQNRYVFSINRYKNAGNISIGLTLAYFVNFRILDRV